MLRPVLQRLKVASRFAPYEIAQCCYRIRIRMAVEKGDGLFHSGANKALYVESATRVEVRVLGSPEEKDIADITDASQKESTPVQALEVFSLRFAAPVCDLSLEDRTQEFVGVEAWIVVDFSQEGLTISRFGQFHQQFWTGSFD